MIRDAKGKLHRSKAAMLRYLSASMTCWKLGLTMSQFEAFHVAHKRRCGVCKKTEKQEGKRLCIDHDHKTGRLRGLLCWHCNFGVGIFKDDPKLFKAALRYLSRKRT